MKTRDKTAGAIDSADVALLVGVGIGLGIVVHDAFFFVAGAIAVGALTAATAHALHERATQAHLAQNRS